MLTDFRFRGKMFKKKFLGVLFVVLVLAFLSAGISFDATEGVAYGSSGTNVGGILWENTTWTKANSPYNLTGPMLVSNGVTLTIEAGATVNLKDYYIRVNGTLVARGNNANQIHFNGGQISFTSVSMNWSEQTATGCIIEKAVLSSATIGVQGTSPKINNNIFSNGGISSGGSAVISNNIFTDCGISIWGVGIYSGSDSGTAVVSNNTLTNGGIAVAGGTISGYPVVFNNTITNLGVSGIVSNGYAYISNNRIYGCQQGISLISFRVFGGGIPSYQIVEKNLIIDNTQGISISLSSPFDPGTLCPTIMNNTISKNSVGIYLSQSNYESSPTVLNNNIQDNSNYNIYLDGTPNNINATYNWWGTTDISSINQTIFDFKNDFNLGTVSFIPFLTEPHPDTPTLPLTVNFTYSPAALYAYGAVTFNATASSGPYSSIVNYTWEFGDGNITTTLSPIVKHTYVTSDSYSVTLTVTDEFGFQNSTATSLTVLQDDAPPTTVDDYDGGWRNADFTITLTATDYESGVAESYYRINNGPVRAVSVDGQPRITVEDANNTLEYWSVDNAGNEELPHKILTGIKLDKTAPTIEIPSRIPENDVEPDQEVKVSVNVADFLSAVKNVTLSYNLNDSALWIDLPMTLNSATGLYEAIILGQQENSLVSYTIAAYDNAGNYKVENNSGQYYIYTIIPEFTRATLAIVLIAVSILAVALPRKSRRGGESVEELEKDPKFREWVEKLPMKWEDYTKQDRYTKRELRNAYRREHGIPY